jgi:L-threonylcarbamoyladenylate synthase
MALTAAVDCLKQGGLVAIPTDTLYGLAADVTNDAAVEKLFQAKRRSHGAPLPILVTHLLQASSLVQNMPPLALKLGHLYWPGPLTLVLRRSPAFHSLALAGRDTVALRVPDHAVPIELMQALGGPITGTSANRSGHAPPCTAAEVALELDDNVDIIIDGGPSPIGVESTVVDVTRERPHILREGAIRRAELETAAGGTFDPEV